MCFTRCYSENIAHSKTYSTAMCCICTSIWRLIDCLALWTWGKRIYSYSGVPSPFSIFSRNWIVHFVSTCYLLTRSIIQLSDQPGEFILLQVFHLPLLFCFVLPTLASYSLLPVHQLSVQAKVSINNAKREYSVYPWDDLVLLVGCCSLDICN